MAKTCPVCGKEIGKKLTTCSRKCCSIYGEKTRKREATNLKRYGHAHFSNPKKGMQTKLLRYGDANYNGNWEERRKRSLEKYGTPSPQQSLAIREKISKTKREKYFRDNPRAAAVFTNIDLMQQLMQSGGVQAVIEASGASMRKTLNVLISVGLHVPNSPISSQEKTVVNLMKMLTASKAVMTNVRGIIQGELDIYVPSIGVAIEYDGMYWHSQPRYRWMYHLHKTNECSNKGIRLFHIFENEWMNDDIQIIWKDILRKAVGSQVEEIDAGDCNIVYDMDCRDFFKENHIYGYTPSIQQVALMYHDLMVAAMLIYNDTIVRYAERIGYRVKGYIKRMLTDYNRPIMITVDKRWTHKDNEIAEIGMYVGDTLPALQYQDNPYPIYDCGEFIYRIKPVITQSTKYK